MVTARSFEAHGTSKRTYKIMLKVRAKCCNIRLFDVGRNNTGSGLVGKYLYKS